MALTTVPASLSATALTLTTAAQPNITSVGTLTGLTVSGNIAGTLTTAAQTNITSLGTLSALTTELLSSTKFKSVLLLEESVSVRVGPSFVIVAFPVTAKPVKVPTAVILGCAAVVSVSAVADSDAGTVVSAI